MMHVLLCNSKRMLLPFKRLGGACPDGLGLQVLVNMHQHASNIWNHLLLMNQRVSSVGLTLGVVEVGLREAEPLHLPLSTVSAFHRNRTCSPRPALPQWPEHTTNGMHILYAEVAQTLLLGCQNMP